MGGAKDEIVLGRPAVVSARVQLPGGKALAVTTQNQAMENVYVQSITWKPDSSHEPHKISDNVLRYTELMAGGTLEFHMGPTPPKVRGHDNHRPSAPGGSRLGHAALDSGTVLFA